MVDRIRWSALKQLPEILQLLKQYFKYWYDGPRENLKFAIQDQIDNNMQVTRQSRLTQNAHTQTFIHIHAHIHTYIYAHKWIRECTYIWVFNKKQTVAFFTPSSYRSRSVNSVPHFWLRSVINEQDIHLFLRLVQNAYTCKFTKAQECILNGWVLFAWRVTNSNLSLHKHLSRPTAVYAT